MKSVFCRIGIALVSCVGASAQIVQWNAAINAQNPLPYQIEQNERRITILAPATDPDEIFSFEAIDDGTGDPTDIDLITVASGVGGTIRVKVARQSGSGDGAANVKGINLTNATSGELWGLKISGDLGTLTGTTVHKVKDALDIDGSMLASGSLGDVSGAITLGGDLSSGNFSIAGCPADGCSRRQGVRGDA